METFSQVFNFKRQKTLNQSNRYTEDSQFINNVPPNDYKAFAHIGLFCFQNIIKLNKISINNRGRPVKRILTGTSNHQI